MLLRSPWRPEGVRRVWWPGLRGGRAGRNPRLAMNPVAAPAKLGPPNAPNAFWAPWARNTAPSVRRNASNPRSTNILPPPKRGGGKHVFKLYIIYTDQATQQIPPDQGSWHQQKALTNHPDLPWHRRA